MRKKLFVVLALLLCAGLVSAQEPIYDYFVYLPMVTSGTAVPTVKPTLAPSTATPTSTPTTTLTPTISITPTLQS